MGDSIRFKRGTTPKRLAYTLAVGEPLVDTDTNTVYIGDGSKVGGHKVGGAGDTTDYTLYAVTTALGGTSTGTGRQLESGTTTSALTGKLVNANASFTTALVGKTVYNTTDGTWAKITAWDLSTRLSLSADIMAVSESYVICDAVTTLAQAYALPDSPYKANVTIRFSPGTFAGDATLIGRLAGENKSITIQGDNTAAGGGTILSGNITVYDSVTLAGGTNYKLKFSGTVVIKGGSILTGSYCDFLKRLETRGNAGCTWSNTLTTSPAKLYKYDNATNLFTSCTITFGNDPGAYTAISSTITKGYTMYVAPSGYGGSDATGDGLQMYSGTVTSVAANKLIDSTANFGTDVVNKPVYNSVMEDWAKVTARDSATQLSLSADIMMSGEPYSISNAFATVQKAVDMTPGTVNCDTEIKIADGSYYEKVTVMGKAFSGAFSLTLKGTMDIKVWSTTANIYSATTIGNNTKAWTVDAYQNMVVRIVSGGGAGQRRIIKSNTATTITIYGAWETNPGGTSVFMVEDWLTIITGALSAGFPTSPERDNCILVTGGQKFVIVDGIKCQYTTNTPVDPEANIFIDQGSSCELKSIWSMEALRTIYCTGASSLTGQGIIAERNVSTNSHALVIGDNSVGSLYAPLIRRNSAYASVSGCVVNRGGVLKIWYGCTIDGVGTGGSGIGLQIDRNGMVQFLYASASYTEIKNWSSTGLYSATGGQCFRSAGVITYSGNGTNENAVAASYGYIGT